MADDGQGEARGPRRHERPLGLDDVTVEALGLLSQALETTQRARGRLYDFHQLTGGADKTVGEAVRRLREAGHDEKADLVEREVRGIDVLPGMWTYQIIEACDDGYHRRFTEVERQVRDALSSGRAHLAEAERGSRRSRARTPLPARALLRRPSSRPVVPAGAAALRAARHRTVSGRAPC
ncbi:hypothetical protein [Streptomyces sp. NPDC001665]